MRQTIVWTTALFLSWTCVVQAQTVNGTLVGDEAFYGMPLSIQDTATHFGDNNNPDPRYSDTAFGFAGGSEIDQVFGRIAGDRLYVLITGNLESNFNKLEVFIDSEAGGVNVLDGANLPTTVDGYSDNFNGGNPPNLPNPFGGALQSMTGMTFDPTFTADHYLTFTNGNEGQDATDPFDPPFWALTAHYAELGAGSGGLFGSLGMQLNAFGQEPGLAPGELVDQDNNDCVSTELDPACSVPEYEFVEPVLPSDPDNVRNHRDMRNIIDLRMGMDNSNIAGVNGVGLPGPWDLSETADPENVVTGLEFSVPLSVLGYTDGDIKVTAFVNSGDHKYVSNQFAGLGLAGAALIDPLATDGGNLGGDGFGGFTGNLAGVNLTTIAGDQFVVISPIATANIDFNNDTLIDCDDVNLLTDAIVNGGDVATFDLNADGMINDADLTVWLADGAAANGFSSPYFRGDANLDGSVDVSDFNIWNGAKFTATAAFCAGDFNADGSVDVSDFNIWNGNKFQSSGMAAVPEPGALLGLLIGVVGLLRFRRR